MYFAKSSIASSFFLTPSKCRVYRWLSGLDIYRDTVLMLETEASVFAHLNSSFFFLAAFHEHCFLSSSIQMHGRHSEQLLCCCSISLRPSNGGQDCPGVNYEYQLCHTDDCPKHFEDFRAQQCQLRNSHFEFQNTKHHWLPYEHPDGKPVKCQHMVGAKLEEEPKPSKRWKKTNLSIEYLYALFTAFTRGLKLSQPLIGSKIPAAQMRNLKQTAVKVIYLFTKINDSSWVEGRAGLQKNPEIPVIILTSSHPSLLRFQAPLNCWFQHESWNVTWTICIYEWMSFRMALIV